LVVHECTTIKNNAEEEENYVNNLGQKLAFVVLLQIKSESTYIKYNLIEMGHSRPHASAL
jgi:hypothetical protein